MAKNTETNGGKQPLAHAQAPARRRADVRLGSSEVAGGSNRDGILELVRAKQPGARLELARASGLYPRMGRKPEPLPWSPPVTGGGKDVGEIVTDFLIFRPFTKLKFLEQRNKPGSPALSMTCQMRPRSILGLYVLAPG